MTAECPYTLQRDAPFLVKIAHFHGDLDLHLTHGSLGQPESSNRTASRSVQPFFAELTSVTDRQTNRPTERPTDHATRSVTIGRIYVRSTAMRPNNNNNYKQDIEAQFKVPLKWASLSLQISFFIVRAFIAIFLLQY